MRFRLLFTVLVVYLGYKYIKNLWIKAASGKPNVHVNNQTEKKPVDIDSKNIVDVEFEEIDDEGDST
ncbi:hypothetical protein DRQ07_00235 [candidate division KSB1 bacterium]|nr:MAG: hypothetical protein DRQ07_00235 [candidate division KSB1 bacterium]